MHFRFRLRHTVLVMLALLAGCANPGIVRISPDTYLLSKEDHGGIFGSMAKLKADTISEADRFASNQGKIAIPISAREKPVGNGPGQWARFEYQFKVVDKVDSEARRTALVPRPDVVIEKTEKISAQIQPQRQSSRPKDVYAELLKLDDLRKRGILSDAEFETQKRKLLSND